MEFGDFILEHDGDDLSRLALARDRFAGQVEDFDLALNTLEARRKLRSKVPEWVALPQLRFPFKLSAEQCSSTETARYKAAILRNAISSTKKAENVDARSDLPVPSMFLGKNVDGGDGDPVIFCIFVNKYQCFMKHLRPLLLLTFALLLAACGSRSSAQKSIDGKYVYEDNISRSVVTISGERWTMSTKFGAPGYRYGTDDKFDAGAVKGNTLYHSGFIPYGQVSGNTLTIGFRHYYKQ